MKYKIKKMEAGGAMVATYTPMARYDSSAPVGNTSNRSDKDSDSKDDMQTVIDKKLYERLITEGGLVNDVNYFVDKLSKISRSSNLPFLQNSNISASLESIKDLNRLQRNKELWDTTYQTAKALGGLDEVAVGKQGEVFVKEGSTFKAISLDQLNKNRDKYNPLTVSELLRARQYDPNLVNNDDVFQVGETANGTTEILKKINDIIDIVAEDTMKTEKHYSRADVEKELALLGVEKSPTAEQRSRFGTLLQMFKTPGDQFKETIETSNKYKYAKPAFDYIKSSLTKEESNKLKAVAAINGISIDQMIGQAIGVGLSGTKISTSIEGEKPVDTLASKAASNSDSDKSLSGFQMFHKGLLHNPNATFTLNDPEWDTMFRGTLESVGAIITRTDETVPIVSVNSLLNDLGYNIFLDGNKAFFGDKKLDFVDKNNIIIEGDIAKVYMPVKADGTPDYDSLENFRDIYALYEVNKNNWSKEKAMSYFRDNNYNITIDQVGGEKIIRDNNSIKPFLIAHGYTNDNTGLTENNRWTKELSSDEEDKIVPILENYWTVGTGKNAVNNTPKGGSWFNSTDYHKGIIAVPYRDNAAAMVDAMAKQGPKNQVSNLEDVQRNIIYGSQIPVNRDFSAANLKPI